MSGRDHVYRAGYKDSEVCRQGRDPLKRLLDPLYVLTFIYCVDEDDSCPMRGILDYCIFKSVNVDGMPMCLAVRSLFVKWPDAFQYRGYRVRKLGNERAQDVNRVLRRGIIEFTVKVCQRKGTLWRRYCSQLVDSLRTI